MTEQINSEESIPESVPETENQDKEEQKGKKKPLKEWIRAFCIALVCFVLLRVFVFDINEVRGTSMEPTLSRSDKVFIDKLSLLGGDPKRGDIVVFRKPGENKRLIKRIIAGPGDRIGVYDGILSINGSPLEEPYILPENNLDLPEMTVTNGILYVNGKALYFETEDDDSVYALEEGKNGVLPEDMFLVLGDNRQISLDSRNWGLLPEDRMVGIARFKFSLFPPRISVLR